ncbi:MAG: hypothetical protein H7328_02340 [Bdellovibrio sp.]|nr:hypothetical protein [Bdellovibrio sp.]
MIGGDIANTKIVFDVGAEYGTGFRTELVAQKAGATNSIETTIASGIGLTINGGVLF